MMMPHKMTSSSVHRRRANISAPPAGTGSRDAGDQHIHESPRPEQVSGRNRMIGGKASVCTRKSVNITVQKIAMINCCREVALAAQYVPLTQVRSRDEQQAGDCSAATSLSAKVRRQIRARSSASRAAEFEDIFDIMDQPLPNTYWVIRGPDTRRRASATAPMRPLRARASRACARPESIISST